MEPGDLEELYQTVILDHSRKPRNFGELPDATVTVDRNIALPDDSALLVSSEGLLGGNFLELVPGGSPTNLDPGAEIEDTQGSVSLISLLTKFVAGSGGGEEPAPASPAPAPAPGSE